MPWWIYLIIGIIAGIIVIVFFCTWLLAYLAISRYSPWCQDKKPWKPHFENPQDMMIFKQMTDWYLKNGEDVWITSKDGYRLYGKYFIKPGAHKTILLVHGYRGRPEGDFCFVNHWLKEENYNFLEINQRSHGLSEGRYIGMGIKEENDIHLWVDYLIKNTDNDIYLWGISMGASTVLLSLSTPFPKNVKGVIADSGYISPYLQFKHMIASYVGRLMATLVMPLCSFWSYLLYSLKIKKADTRKILKNVSLPILFIHGEKDNFVPYWMSKVNYSCCVSTKKEMLLVKNATHGRCFLNDRENYILKVKKIIED